MKQKMTWPLVATFILIASLMTGCGNSEGPKPVGELPENSEAMSSESVETEVPETSTTNVPDRPYPQPPAPPKPPVNLYQLDLEAVQNELAQLNPGYGGQGQIVQQGPGVIVSVSGAPISNITPLKKLPIFAMEAAQTPIEDLAPLRNMPMDQLYLEDTKVWNLEPLRGMPLTKLYLSNTFVKDLGPLKGMGITEMNLLGTPVGDITALEGMPLNSLWLTGTRVSDVSPLVKSPLVSLTLHKTRVTDIAPLAEIQTLQRLHIGETPVDDLSAIANMNLTRLVFTPSNIKKGLEAVRNSTSIRELGLRFEQRGDVMPPQVFWERYDNGDFSGE